MSIKQKHIAGFDGTEIGYQVMGKGKKAFVLCNGLGGSAYAWSPIYEQFLDHFKFITWDYRGLFTSDVPEDLSSLALPNHIKDLQIILKKERIRSGLVAGWSMGVQVALELYRNMPEFVEGLFLMNGTYGNPFGTAFNSPLSKFIIPKINNLVIKLMPKIQNPLKPVAKGVISRDEFIKLVVKLGLIHNASHSHIFQKVATDIVETDLAVYHMILEELGKHDASSVLPEIQVPTLIVTGSKDVLTPVKTAEKMAETIPDAELFVMSAGSHYALMEFPDLINGRLRQFLSEHGFFS